MPAPSRQGAPPSTALLLPSILRGQANPDDRKTRPDNRSRKDRRAGRRAYRKATKHYGKTYVLTRNQIMSGLAVCIGMSMLMSVGLFRAYLWMVEQMELALL